MLFNLARDPWIPVLTCGGDRIRVSLRDALLTSDQLTALACETPTQAPAVLRQLLIPVVMDTLGLASPAQWCAVFRRGRFSDGESQTLSSYLDRHGDRFDLFHPDMPFGQVAGLRTEKDATRPVNVLIAHEPSGSAVPVFGERSDARPVTLTPADAALWLLHVHCWDSGAIKTGAVGDPAVKAGKTMGNPVGPLGQFGVVVPVGRTLFETVLLNTPLTGDDVEHDLPPWRRAPATAAWTSRAATGIVDLLTWQSRRVRLIPEHRGGEVVVARAVLAGGDRLTETPDWEPHATWRRDSTKENTWRPARHRLGGRGWRGLDALLALSRPAAHDEEGASRQTSTLLRRLADPEIAQALGSAHPVAVELCGLQYNTKQTSIVDAFADTVPLSVAALSSGRAHGAALEIAALADAVGTQLKFLETNLRRAAGQRAAGSGRGPEAEFYFAVDPDVRNALRALGDTDSDPDAVEACLTAWEHAAHSKAMAISRAVLNEAGAAAFNIVRTEAGHAVSFGAAKYGFLRGLARVLTRLDREGSTREEVVYR